MSGGGLCKSGPKNWLAIEIIGVVRKASISAMGQQRSSRPRSATSGLPQSTDIARLARLVRFVPKADSCAAANCVLSYQLLPRANAGLIGPPLSEGLQLAASSLLARPGRSTWTL